MTDILRCQCKDVDKPHQRRNEQAGYIMHLCREHAESHDLGYTFVVGRTEVVNAR